MKGLRIVAELNQTLNQIENSRQAIINRSETLNSEEQKMLYKINGHLKRIHNDLNNYNKKQINCIMV